ncbi:MAG: SDR family oxidoreductase [Gammaproteobacteria bacterium]
MDRFKNSIVLVTGGTQGMGLAAALRFAQEGASVCVSGRDSNKGEDALKILNGISNNVIFIQCDIANSQDAENLVSRCVERFGRLDIAFNNAGVTSEYALLADSDDAHWENVIKTNSCGTYYCMKYEIRAMLKNKGGVIINNASCVGLMPIPKQSAYVASKHAVIGLTKSAAMDYADTSAGQPQIRINAVAPGPILGGMNSTSKHANNSDNVIRKSGFTAMNRFGSQEEVAATVLWLASDEASYITGTVISIDGGMSAGKWH